MKLKKSDWYAKRNSGEVKDDELVKIWSLPHGCRCNISDHHGTAILRNGETSAINTEIAKELIKAGITGDVLINSTNSLPQTVSRWLTWWLSNAPKRHDDGFNSIRVAVFDVMPTKRLPFEVEVLKSYSVPASDVLRVLSTKSHDLGLSLLAVERENGDYFELEPIRYTQGVIKALTPNGFVVSTSEDSKTLPILINRVSKNTRAMMDLHGIAEQDLVGSTVRIQYTMFTAGTRISNYKAAVIYSIEGLLWDDLEELHTRAEENGSGITYEHATMGGKSGLLTPSRCGRAILKDKGDVIEGVEAEDGNLLYRYEEGIESGQYAAILTRRGERSIWRFNSPYNIEIIAPASFISHTDNSLYHSTGYSIETLGIYYEDAEGRAFIGNEPIDIKECAAA